MRVLEAIKSFLKRFLPPPVRAFNREVERILTSIENLNSALIEIRSIHAVDSKAFAELKAIQEANSRAVECLSQQNAELVKTLSCIAEQIGTVSYGLSTINENLLSAKQAVLAEQKSNAQDNEIKLLKLQEEFSNVASEIKAIEQNLGDKQQNDSQNMQILRQEISAVAQTVNSTMEQKLKTLESGVVAAVKRVERLIPNKQVFWNNDFERGVVEANWGDVSLDPDFAEKYIRLINGLDVKSIETITRILARQRIYLNSKNKEFNFFTQAEQEKMRLLNENFTAEIIKLSDNLYAYRNYLLPVDHFESSVFYYKHGLSELYSTANFKGKTIVDVGGFIGDSVLILNELAPRRIYTFEAVPENFELLKKTVELNSVPNVIAENVALGAERGGMTIHVCGSGSTAIERPGLNYSDDITVPVMSFDEYVDENGIDDIALIKIDIEGGEPAFLAGAKETICRQKPTLLVSIYHNAHDFFELKPMIESWNLGYKFKIHKPAFGNSTSETLLICEIV